jgi:nitrous oxide reductase accessory protein NosL
MVDDGVEVTAVYVTDYSWIDWETSENTERKKMPAPTAPDTFVDATDFIYAVETDVMEGMRPDPILFSETDEAVRFTETHGGHTIEYDDIDRVLVERIRMSGMK